MIALFYSDRIEVVPLVVAVALIVAIALVRFLPVGRGPAYAVLGFALWIALFMAGVHPTLAGVATRAADSRLHAGASGRWSRPSTLIRAFRQSPNSQYARAADSRSAGVDFDQRAAADRRSAPTCRSLVLPLFALANAGVRLDTRQR